MDDVLTQRAVTALALTASDKETTYKEEQNIVTSDRGPYFYARINKEFHYSKRIVRDVEQGQVMSSLESIGV